MATRAFSLNGGVGAGFSEPDLVDGLIDDGVTFDLVVNDAGTMDGGPSFLATEPATVRCSPPG